MQDLKNTSLRGGGVGWSSNRACALRYVFNSVDDTHKMETAIAEKDRQLAEKDKIIVEKDKQISELQEQLRKFQHEFMETTKVALDRFLGLTPHEFLIQSFSQCQKRKKQGDWTSNTFHSHTGGYKLALNVETKQTGSFMKVYLQHGVRAFSPEMDWPVTFVVTLQLLNQLSDHDHYTKSFECTFSPATLAAHSVVNSTYCEYITFEELHRKDKAVEYLKDDCLKLRMWIRMK